MGRAYLFSQLTKTRRASSPAKYQVDEGVEMSFTVTRAVRGVGLPATEAADKLQRAIIATPAFSASMDLPYAEEVLHLDLSDFAETVPGERTP